MTIADPCELLVDVARVVAGPEPLEDRLDRALSRLRAAVPFDRAWVGAPADEEPAETLARFGGGVGDETMISTLELPLVSSGRQIGLLRLASRREEAFAPAEVLCAEVVSYQLAAAIAIAALAREEHAAATGQGAFLRIMAHDLRNAITVIRGRAQLMLRRQPEGAGAPGLRAIVEGAERMDQLVGRMAELAEDDHLRSGSIKRAS